MRVVVTATTKRSSAPRSRRSNASHAACSSIMAALYQPSRPGASRMLRSKLHLAARRSSGLREAPCRSPSSKASSTGPTSRRCSPFMSPPCTPIRRPRPVTSCPARPSPTPRSPSSPRAKTTSLLGFGALKALGDGEGEIKSMRTDPAALGKGVGKAILAAITAEARARGYARLLLETGTTPRFRRRASPVRARGLRRE